MDFLEKILTVEGSKDALLKKALAFGCEAKTCEGHDSERIVAAIKEWVVHERELIAPQVLIANTVKGYGLLCMENVPKFHFRVPTDDELKEGDRYEKS